MWQKLNKGFFKKPNNKFFSLLICLCMGSLLLMACGAGAMSGAATTSNTSSMPAAHMPAQTSNSSGNTNALLGKQVDQSTQAGSAGTPSGQVGPQYLQKTLEVTMQVQDTRATASALQQWLGTTDPQATSAGLDYEQVGNNQYTVTLTFLVDVAHYIQVQDYLRDYAGKDGNILISMHETVQDLTNDYIDTQTRLTDLRAEQQRLLGFLNQSQNLSDTLNIEQQLTQVESQINSIEAHLNALKGQTSFYTVTITLQPIGTPQPITPTPGPWSVIPVWQGAWNAVIGVWQVLLTMLVWLGAFSVYIVPAGVVFWLVKRWRRSRGPLMAPASPISRVSPTQPKDVDPE